MAADTATVTEDAVLGGRLVLRQPRKGHRVGHDAILLAAATVAEPGGHLVDLGSGVGAAGLAVARRIDDLAVSLVEIDPALVSLARDNVALNGFAERVRTVCLDVAAPPAAFAAAGLGPESADQVMINPPFNSMQARSPDPGRRLAHAATQNTLPVWLGAAARLLRRGGTMTLIWRAEELGDVLAGLAEGFGAVTVLPVHGRPHAPAIRVLVSAVRSSGAPLSLLPALFLTDEAGRPAAQAEAVLRDGAALVLSGS